MAERSKARVCGLSLAVSNPAWGMHVSCECSVLSGIGLCDGPIPRLEVSYQLRFFIVCGPETSRMRRAWYEMGCCAKEGKNYGQGSFLFSKTSRPALRSTQPYILVGTGVPSRTESTHLHLVPKSEMDGVIPLFPLYAFVTFSGTNLCFYFAIKSTRFKRGTFQENIRLKVF